MQAAYGDLLTTARRHARLTHEAEDIVQNALLAALEAERSNLDDPQNRRWLHGVIRNQARMQARTAVRRKAREASHGAAPSYDAVDDDGRAELFAWVRGLPASQRPVAALALTGHTRAEIRSLLGIADTALRQRLRALKRVAITSGLTPGHVSALRPDLAHGVLRRNLPPVMARRAAAFGTYDPDGNLLIFRTSVLTDPAGTATGTGKPAIVAGATRKTET